MHLHPEALFIIQAGILIGLPFALWKLKIVQKFIPLVVVQIILGVILGPSVLGRIGPGLYETLFPAQSLAILSGFSWLALLLFGFLTGLHLDLEQISGKGVKFILISLSTIVVPALLGALGAAWLYSPDLIGGQASRFIFIFGLAITTGVTALPVLGAILMELKLIEQPIGKKVLGYATMNDLILWILVSLLLVFTQSQGAGSNAGLNRVAVTLVATVLYLGIMTLIVRPILERLVNKGVLTSHPDNLQLVIVLTGMFISALATELIGIHYLLGAFAFGAFIPKTIAESYHHALGQLVTVILLPFFFMLTGLKTVFDATHPLVWIVFAIMTVMAMVGKIAGTVIPEKIYGTSTKEAYNLGVLMQTKGLMDVVVLNLLLQGQIISPIMFSALMLRAIVTTASTKPGLMLVDKIFASRHSAPKQAAILIENPIRQKF